MDVDPKLLGNRKCLVRVQRIISCAVIIGRDLGDLSYFGRQIGRNRLIADQFVGLAGRFGLGGKLEQDPALLSEGEKRKFQVIMTLLKDADFYIFDEPLSNVDVESSDLIMNSIISGTSGKALMVIMHGGDRYRGLFDRQFSLSMERAANEAAVDERLVAACVNA